MLTKEVEIESLSPEELLSNGKKAYNASDFENALTYLSTACKKFAVAHGDISDFMLEPHFYYAKSLYEYAKQDIGELNDVDEVGDTEKSDKIQINTKDVKDSKEVKIEEKSKKPEPAENGDSIKDNDVEKKDDTTGLNDKDASEDTQVDGESKDNGENKEDETETKEDESEIKNDKDDEPGKSDDDDVSSFQLAFENIECAKLILDRQLSSDKYDKKEVESKLADCYILTGHILMEDDQDESCLNEYQNALEIRLKHGEKGAIAESYMYLGMACCNQYKWRDAKRHYENCKEVLEKIGAGLESTDERYSENREFVEAINQRLEDVEDGLRQMQQTSKLMKTMLNGAGDSSATSATKRKAFEGTAVNDLSSVVRKKPKLETSNNLA